MVLMAFRIPLVEEEAFMDDQAAGYRRTLFKLVVEDPRIYPVIRDA